MSSRSTVAARLESGAAFQIVILSGLVHGEVVSGVTSTGESLCSFDLAIVGEDGRCLVPLTWRNVATPSFAAGDALVVRGRVVKRFHRAGAATIARTSVEVDEAIEAPKPAAIRRMVTRAVEPVGIGSARTSRSASR